MYQRAASFATTTTSTTARNGSKTGYDGSCCCCCCSLFFCRQVLEPSDYGWACRCFVENRCARCSLPGHIMQVEVELAASSSLGVDLLCFWAVMTLACGRGSTLAKDWTTRTLAASQILSGRFSCVCLQVSSRVCVRQASRTL